MGAADAHNADVLLVGAVLLAIFWLPSPWGVVAIVAAAAVELAEIAVWIWWSRRGRPVAGVEALPGSTAVVVAATNPVGQVRVGGELWRARSDAPAAAGEQVVVVSVDRDLTLHVRHFPGGA